MADKSFVRNIANYLEEASRQFPYQTAIISAKKNLFGPRTFKELNNEAIRCSSLLHSKRIKKGDKVLLAVKPGYQLILITFSLFRIGAIPVIIDPGMGIKPFLACIKRTKPNALVGIPLIYFFKIFFRNAFKSVQNNVIVRNKIFDKQVKQFKEENLIAVTTTNPDETAAIVFTSGSTGPPKGVVYTHKMFDAQINHLKKDFHIKNGEIDLATLPIFSLFNPALGVTTVIPEMNPRKPAFAQPCQIVQAIQKFKINSGFASPVIGEKIFRYCNQKKIKLPHMKRLFLAGAPTHPSLVENLAKILVNGQIIIPYGATEALPVSATNHIEVKSLAKEVSIGKGSVLGKPLSGNTVRIMPISFAPFESGTFCPEQVTQGEVGEICVSGPVVSEQYFQMPGSTVDSKFLKGKQYFHRMGDLGYFDNNGILRFLGRKVERVLSKNGPLETERCEPIVNSIKNVSRSALIGLGNGKIKEPCIVIELKKTKKKINKEIVREKILKQLNNYLPSFSFKYIVFEYDLPVDPRHNAKIHRLSLAKKWTGIIESNKM